MQDAIWHGVGAFPQRRFEGSESEGHLSDLPTSRPKGPQTPAQVEWRSGSIAGMRVHPPRLSKVGQYRADRSTLRQPCAAVS